MHRILLVGGGTAGHVEPALAVGNWLLANSTDVSCEFVGTKSGIENELVPLAGLKLHRILKAPMPRKPGVAAIIWPIKLAVSVLQAIRIVRSADAVIGFGGYVSAPCYLAAKIARVPLFIHEANALPGWANKLGAKFAIEKFIAFKNTSAIGGVWADAKLVGMPIRDEIFAIGAMSKSDRSKVWDATYRELGLDRTKRTVFIFGGSLGAQTINKVVAESLPELLKLDLNIVHGVGQGNSLPKAQTGYFPLAYISKMADMYVASDLIISRGGAVTCAEVDAANAFALIVPLAIGNGEQVANAGDLLTKGAAEICLNSDFSAQWLLTNIERLMLHAEKWNSSRTAQNSLPAAETIGKIILKNLSSTGGSTK